MCVCVCACLPKFIVLYNNVASLHISQVPNPSASKKNDMPYKHEHPQAMAFPQPDNPNMQWLIHNLTNPTKIRAANTDKPMTFRALERKKNY